MLQPHGEEAKPGEGEGEGKHDASHQKDTQ